MRREEFTQSRFILTEGFEDCALARAILRFRKPRLPMMDIDPVDNLGETRGKKGFTDAIIAADGKRNFSDVTGVIFLSDNDEKPSQSFEFIRQQIITANATGLQRNWAVPDQPSVTAVGNPSVSIWMWPQPGKPGCMETLLWEIIKAKYAALASCVDKACACMETDKWPVQKLDKARVRSFLALYNKRNPVIRFDVLWRDFPEILPIDRKELSELVKFIRAI